MKFTLHFGNNTFPDLAGAVRMVKLAEAAGFDSVLVSVFDSDFVSVAVVVSDFDDSCFGGPLVLPLA